MNNEVSIQILGKTYRIKCQSAFAKDLEQSAAYLEKMLHEFNEKNKNKKNLEAPAIVTALNLAHEVLSLKDRLKRLNDILLGAHIAAVVPSVDR